MKQKVIMQQKEKASSHCL